MDDKVIYLAEPKEETQEQHTIRRSSVGRGKLPVKLKKPIIYFAGRLNNNSKRNTDWRNCIEDYLLSMNFNYHKVRDQIVDLGTFWYGGPFVCDDSGGHGPPGHGPYRKQYRLCQDIWDIDTFQIDRADLVVAYIDDMRAYGTLVEIGYAAAKNKTLLIGFFSEKLSFDDFMDLWLCRMPAARIYYGEPERVWSSIKRDWILT